MKQYAVLAAGALAFAGQAHATTVLDTSLLNLPGGTTGAPSGALGTAGTVSTAPGGGSSVSSANKDQWIQRNVRNNASVGITNYQAQSGNGSVVFASPNGSGKADLDYLFSNVVQLSSVLGGSYDWFRDIVSDNPVAQVPAYRLILGNASGVANGTYLIFEPVYNGVPTPTEGVWQTSAFTQASTFWANNNNINRAAGVASCDVGCFDSLADWISVNQDLTVIGLSVGVGSGWSGNFLGAVDNVAYDFGDAGQNSFNFEVAEAAGAVPEPATWAMMLLGFGAMGAAMRRRPRQQVRFDFA